MTRVSCALRFLGAVTLLGVFATAFTPVVNRLRPLVEVSPDIRPADAIVVLGGAADPDVLKDASLRRAVHGMRLYARGYAPVLLFSGQSWETEARARLARDLGLAPEGILTLPVSNTTREEAARVLPVLRRLRARSILLVSDPQHLVRARRLFARARLEVLPAPIASLSPHTSDPDERLDLMRQTLVELAARVYYGIRTSLSTQQEHP